LALGFDLRAFCLVGLRLPRFLVVAVGFRMSPFVRLVFCSIARSFAIAVEGASMASSLACKIEHRLGQFTPRFGSARGRIMPSLGVYCGIDIQTISPDAYTVPVQL
jgi:hypothetical protein